MLFQPLNHLQRSLRRARGLEDASCQRKHMVPASLTYISGMSFCKRRNVSRPGKVACQRRRRRDLTEVHDLVYLTVLAIQQLIVRPEIIP